MSQNESSWQRSGARARSIGSERRAWIGGLVGVLGLALAWTVFDRWTGRRPTHRHPSPGSSAPARAEFVGSRDLRGLPRCASPRSGSARSISGRCSPRRARTCRAPSTARRWRTRVAPARLSRDRETLRRPCDRRRTARAADHRGRLTPSVSSRSSSTWSRCPGGRLQALPLRGIPGEGSGRPALVPSLSRRARSARGDPLHWTRPAQNWNHVCADCHTTGFPKALRRRERTRSTRIGRSSASVARAVTVRAARTSRGQSAREDATFARPRRTRGPDGPRGAARRTPGRPLDDRSHDGQCRPLDIPRTSARELDVCAPVPRPPQQPHGALCRGRALPRPLPPGAARARSLFRRWPAARRGLQLGLVPPEPHVREGRHLQRLSRAPFGRAARRGQCAVRELPCADEVRDGLPPSPRRRLGRERMRRLPYADDDLHAVVDPRHDHSLRVPRPDQSVALGVPNACNGCHVERKPAWADGGGARLARPAGTGIRAPRRGSACER